MGLCLVLFLTLAGKRNEATRTEAGQAMTKLKCKNCKLFYPDDGSITECDQCGGELKQITVHGLKPVNIVSQPKNKTRK